MGFWSNLFFGESKKSKSYIVNADRMKIFASNIKDNSFKKEVLTVLEHIKLIREEKPDTIFGNSLMNNMGLIVKDKGYRNLYIRICEYYVPPVIAIGSRLNNLMKSLKNKEPIHRELYKYLETAQREIEIDSAIIKKYKLDRLDVDVLRKTG